MPVLETETREMGCHCHQSGCRRADPAAVANFREQIRAARDRIRQEADHG